jgi:hypothetical protein
VRRRQQTSRLPKAKSNSNLLKPYLSFFKVNFTIFFLNATCVPVDSYLYFAEFYTNIKPVFLYKRSMSQILIQFFALYPRFWKNEKSKVQSRNQLTLDFGLWTKG